jgi:hypothetical protein
MVSSGSAGSANRQVNRYNGLQLNNSIVNKAGIKEEGTRKINII